MIQFFSRCFSRLLSCLVTVGFLAFAFPFMGVLANIQSAHADAYSWQDSSGITFFGSNPPAGATNVKKLGARSFSRYSSEKVIRGYNKSAENAGRENTARMSRNKIKEADLPTSIVNDEATAPDAQERPGARAKLIDAPEVSPAPSAVPPISGGTAALEQGKITVTHDANQWVSACKVIIKNPGTAAAQKVLVSFEFEDGTIVPAKGPEVIAGKGEAVYFIAPESLPVKVHYQRPAKTVTGISYQKLPRPKVIIQSTPAI